MSLLQKSKGKSGQQRFAILIPWGLRYIRNQLLLIWRAGGRKLGL